MPAGQLLRLNLTNVNTPFYTWLYPRHCNDLMIYSSYVLLTSLLAGFTSLLWPYICSTSSFDKLAMAFLNLFMYKPSSRICILNFLSRAV